MLCGLFGCLDIVNIDGGSGQTRPLSLDDDWRLGLDEAFELLVIPAGAGKDDPIHVLATQQLRTSSIAFFNRDRGKKHFIVSGGCSVVYSPQHLGQERIRKRSLGWLTLDVSNDARLPSNQATGGGMGMVIEIMSSFNHPFSCFFTDPHPGDIVKDEGNRRPGNSSSLGNVLSSHPPWHIPHFPVADTR
jgi:hypothetical protein